MSMETFERLAPFIQDYIYRNRWEELRDIQVSAIREILDGKGNVLLASATASGKTEAAFLPILTDLYYHPSTSVGVIYISPLKALINDQFERLTELLVEANFKVTKWHGDVSNNEKRKLLSKPTGLLQITPESLESMLMRRRTDCIRLFADLRYIVIDEVHYFMNSSRGIQLLCILERLMRLVGNVPRRVGLSATLGDYLGAKQWLNSGTFQDAVIISQTSSKKVIRLLVEHFCNNQETEKKETEEFAPFFEFIYDITKTKKCIIFSNAKADVETTIAYLRRIAENKNTKDIYHVHHGNISASLREYTEDMMRNSEQAQVVGATVTLELGIDIGELERIVQTGTPMSVSSFVQRLGRAGRRGHPSEMVFAFQEDKVKENVEFYKLINFELLLSIAIIELYIKEKWIEPIKERQFPFGILFHQMISFLMSSGDVTPSLLAQQMLTLSPFRYISQEDLKLLLTQLLKEEMIEKTEEDKIMVGLKGEAIANNYEFYAVFDADIEYAVKSGSEEIGSISEPYPIGAAFALAGSTWEVLEVNHRQKIVYVKKVKGISNISWTGKSHYLIHTKLMKKIKEILLSEESYPYLTERAKNRLYEMRGISRNAGILKKQVIRFNPNTYGIFVWLGTAAMNALRYAVSSYFDSVLPIYQGFIPLGLIVKTELGIEYVREVLRKIEIETIDVNNFKIDENTVYAMPGKFNIYIPYVLLKKQFIDEYIDVEDMQQNLHI